MQSGDGPSEERIDSLKLGELTVDDVASWSRTNEQVFVGNARIALVTLNQVFRFAVGRGWLAESPVAKLEPA